MNILFGLLELLIGFLYELWCRVLYPTLLVILFLLAWFGLYQWFAN